MAAVEKMISLRLHLLFLDEGVVRELTDILGEIQVKFRFTNPLQFEKI